MLHRSIQIHQAKVQVQQDLSLSHAGTVWDGALVLAYFFEKNENICSKYIFGKTVLELGSGTGILGLSVGLLKPCQLILSDLSQFLPILHTNLNLNKQIAQGGTKMVVKGLEWGNKQDMQQAGKIDCIIGSQLAYDADNIGYLIETFTYFMRINPKLAVIISYQTYPQPHRNLKERIRVCSQFKIEQVPSKDMHQEYRDDGIGILIITNSQQN